MQSSAAVSRSGKDPLAIRKARVTDAARLAQLSAVLGYPVEVDVITRRLARLLARPEHLILVAKETQEPIAGWVHAAEHDILEVGRFCEILGLVVAADQRGKGIGRRLVAEAERWAVERGLHRMSVRSNIVRTESHLFYKRVGYVREKTQHAYRKYLR